MFLEFRTKGKTVKIYSCLVLNILYQLFFYSEVSAQIKFANPSFEDQPADATVPKGWLPCEPGSTPDILPGFWGEYGLASDGETYVGLITRQDKTFESIGQRLSQPLEIAQCYKFKIDLAKGRDYVGFSNPLKLRVWVGNSICDKSIKVYESPLISSTSWNTYEVEFQVNSKYQYLILEAYHSDRLEPYKGNILLDNMSFIYPCKRV